MISVLFGIAAVAIGLWGMQRWFGELISLLRGILPISFFFAGVIAILAGVSGMRDGKDAGSGKKDHEKT